MEKCLSIVLSSDVKNYRKVAQVHWGLTDAQMKGKHVHHHPAVSEGGRNVPEHLYVCSPSMHAHGWHNGEYFIEQAAIGAAKGARKGGLAVPHEARVRGGMTQGHKSLEEGTGLFAPGSVTKESCAEGGRVGGKKRAEQMHAERDEQGRSLWTLKMHEEKDEHGRSLLGLRSAAKAHAKKDDRGKSVTGVKAASTTNSQKWVDPDHPELGAHSSGVLAVMQKNRGYPHAKANRVKLG